MIILNQRILWATFVLLCSPAPLFAQQGDVNQASIQQWIEQLDADSLTKRQEARSQLTKAGQAAIPALAKAAISEKRGLIVHSIDILAELRSQSEDEDTKSAATIALKMLAESDSPSTAQRAKLALDAKKDDGIQAFPGWDQPGTEFAGNAANRSVSVSSMNGIKTITVKEGGKTTTLQDQRSGAIRVKIEGVGDPKEFVAKDLDELKQKDPAAFAIYQQHGGNAGGLNVANFNGFGQAGFGDLGNFARNQAVGKANDDAGTNPASQIMIQQLKELKKRMAGHPQMQEILNQQIKDLEK